MEIIFHLEKEEVDFRRKKICGRRHFKDEAGGQLVKRNQRD